MRPAGPARPAERRAQIVEAAADVFRGRDPAGVRFEEVARAAGVSRSLVYAYFGDRGELHRRGVPPQPGGHRRGAVRPAARRARSTSAGWGRWSAPTWSWRPRTPTSWRLFAAAGAIDHPAVQQARQARCQRIADTWGGGPAERLLARGLVGMLEAAASEWLEHRGCSLDDAVALLTQALWNGVGRLPRRRLRPSRPILLFNRGSRREY